MILTNVLVILVLTFSVVFVFKYFRLKKKNNRLIKLCKSKDDSINDLFHDGFFPKNKQEKNKLEKIGVLLGKKNVLSKDDARFLSEFLTQGLDE